MQAILTSRRALAAVALSLFMQLTSHAALVTFGFQAEVISILDTLPGGSGFDVEVGESITGQFSFEPVILPPLAKPLEFQDLSISQTSEATITVRGIDFELISSPLNLNFRARKNQVVNDGLAELQDSINIEGIGLMALSAPFQSYDSNQSSFDFTFEGIRQLDSAQLPTDVQVWNDLDLHRLVRLHLLNSEGVGVSIQARVDPLFVVPEPLSISIASIFALVALGVWRTR